MRNENDTSFQHKLHITVKPSLLLMMMVPCRVTPMFKLRCLGVIVYPSFILDINLNIQKRYLCVVPSSAMSCLFSSVTRMKSLFLRGNSLSFSLSLTYVQTHMETWIPLSHTQVGRYSRDTLSSQIPTQTHSVCLVLPILNCC